MSTTPLKITYLPPWLPDTWVTYQRYYAIGLEKAAKRLGVRFPPAWLLRGVDKKIIALARLGQIRHRLRPITTSDGLVGRYVAEVDGRKIKFAIDARDSHPIHDPDVLAWSEVYFKSNRWPHVEYDAKVTPIVNGNGLIGYRQIELLKGLRDHPKDLDVAFISNIRGGVEHNLRLFEELAKLDCKKELVAVFPPGFGAEEQAGFSLRLAKAGVRVGEVVPPIELWSTLARAKVVLIRSGHHLCISWRMIDLLCMGACIAYDAPPIPQWPEPLLPGVHYVDLGTLDRSIPDAPSTHYERLTPTLERVLQDEALMERMRHSARTYFDEHAAPECVAEYVVQTLAKYAANV